MLDVDRFLTLHFATTRPIKILHSVPFRTIYGFGDQYVSISEAKRRAHATRKCVNIARQLRLCGKRRKGESEASAAIHSSQWRLHQGGGNRGFLPVISRVFIERNDGLHKLRFNKIYGPKISVIPRREGRVP